jgi:predicted transcriptional regulator
LRAQILQSKPHGGAAGKRDDSQIRFNRIIAGPVAWERGETNENRPLPLAKLARQWFIRVMTAQAVIKQFKALKPKERAEVAKFVVESDDSWIPESFKRGMADAEAGRFADMDTVLNDAPPPLRDWRY